MNVIRIQVGFWMKEDLVRRGEHFPRGALKYLDRAVDQAADAGLYLIIGPSWVVRGPISKSTIY